MTAFIAKAIQLVYWLILPPDTTSKFTYIVGLVYVSYAGVTHSRLLVDGVLLVDGMAPSRASGGLSYSHLAKR